MKTTEVCRNCKHSSMKWFPIIIMECKRKGGCKYEAKSNDNIK